ncbi:hypothetical protein L6452_34282 [Arctium lappa]|uniref:Uncharacterized protein n=1 Tax=Arctium lappa TaxID=4217 RepID=A0ACB8YIY9_ARCLA|nr:hypothetical protein L6452_34282 [Arctium lappa]
MASKLLRHAIFTHAIFNLLIVYFNFAQSKPPSPSRDDSCHCSCRTYETTASSFSFHFLRLPDIRDDDIKFSHPLTARLSSAASLLFTIT